MKLPADLVQRILELPPAEAWRLLGDEAGRTCALLRVPEGDGEVLALARERRLQALDLLLSEAGPALWRALPQSVPPAVTEWSSWWESRPPGRALLLLEGLSLRETPWLLSQARGRGLRVRAARWRRAELPGDPVTFRSTLGLPGREREEAAVRGGLQIRSTDLPFPDCTDLVGPEPDQVLWHRWPSSSVRRLSGSRRAVREMAREAEETLSSDGFWATARRLAQGRGLVLTSDRGYALPAGTSKGTPGPGTTEVLVRALVPYLELEALPT